MRRVAYVLTLIGIWAASLAAIALGLDGILGHPPFLPIALIGGAYFGSISTVSLAEEIAEALGRSRGPCGETWRSRGIGQRHYLVPARGGATVSAPDRRVNAGRGLATTRTGFSSAS